VIARNRTNRGDDDLVLSHIDELNIDQLWLMAVDVGDGLTTADAYAIQRFRENGGGVLTARGHHDLGRCLSRLGSLGVAYEFHTKTVDAWPNYHSGASGDYQPVLVEVPVHELLRTNQTASGRIEWFAPITRAIAVRRLPFQFLASRVLASLRLSAMFRRSSGDSPLTDQRTLLRKQAL
jgi:hypothetical protein